MGLLPDKRPMSWYDPGKFWSGDEIVLVGAVLARRGDRGPARMIARRRHRRGADGHHPRAVAGVGRARARGSWPSPIRTARRAERLGAPAHVYADGLELIAADDVDAVVVASPVFTHEPFVLACIEAGQAGAVREAARRHRRGGVADRRGRARRRAPPRHRRLHAPLRPGLRRSEGPARRGRDRRPLLVHCAHRNPSVHAFFDSAMIITDSAVHEADILRWLLGEEIVARRGARAARRPPRARRAAGPAARSCWRRRPACSRTSRRSSARATATTSAARSWGRTGRSRCRSDVSSGFAERFAAAYGHELRAWIAGDGAWPARPTGSPRRRCARPAWSRSGRRAVRDWVMLPMVGGPGRQPAEHAKEPEISPMITVVAPSWWSCSASAITAV